MGAVDLAVCGVKRLVKRRARAMGSMGSMGSMGVQACLEVWQNGRADPCTHTATPPPPPPTVHLDHSGGC